MGIASVLAMIDGGTGSDSAVRTALAVGRAFNAYVEFLHVEIEPESIIPVVAEGMPATTMSGLIEGAREMSAERAKAAQAVTRAAVDGAGLTLGDPDDDPVAGTFSVAWRRVLGSESSEGPRRARLFDLTVMARPSDEALLEGGSPLIDVLFESGRPVLMAPPTAPDAVGTTVAVAWRDTADAARAVAAANPFLREAGAVTLLTVQERDAETPLPDVGRYLRRHGVKPTSVALPEGSADTASRLLAAAGEAGADLMVMGAYGHSRLRELILGGVTRDVLKSAEIPVLMVH